MGKSRKQLRKNTYRKRRSSLKRRSRRFFSRRGHRVHRLRGGGVDPTYTGSYVADGAVVDIYEQDDDIPGPVEFRTKAVADAEKAMEEL
jgi:hypothetical protein